MQPSTMELTIDSRSYLSKQTPGGTVDVTRPFVETITFHELLERTLAPIIKYTA